MTDDNKPTTPPHDPGLYLKDEALLVGWSLVLNQVKRGWCPLSLVADLHECRDGMLP